MLAFADELSDLGYDLGPGVSKIRTRWDAVLGATTFDPSQYLAGDLVALEPDEIAQRARDAAVDLTVRENNGQRVRDDFESALYTSAGAALRGQCDTVVATMRKDFNKHVRVVEAAAKHGLNPTTEVAALAHSGSAAALAAFRALPDAVNALETITSIRIRMSEVLDYGPPLRNDIVHLPGGLGVHDSAAFVTLDESHSLEGARARWDGPVEFVSAAVEGSLASTVMKARKARVGGALARVGRRWIQAPLEQRR
jgi:hypothetical protein